MKILHSTLLLGLFLCSLASFGQTKRVTFTVERPQNQINDDSVYIIADKMPIYPGGNSAMQNDISRNLIYPELSAENGEAGIVFIQFTVDENGLVIDPIVLTGTYPLLNAEAMRGIKKLKRFTPGYIGEKPVKVSLTTPVTFKLY